MRIIAGLVIFVTAAFFRVPHLLHPAWAHALLGFAALVLGPPLLDLIGDDADDDNARRRLAALKKAQFPAAALLVLACVLPPGVAAVLAGLPWACVLLVLAAIGLRRVIRRGWQPLSRLCRDIGLIYAAVAALWLTADRAGLRPLGFDEAIVLLTAVHFHYAGLLLPVLAGLALEKLPSSAAVGAVGIAAIAGVPGVAVGITAAQLGLGHTGEMGAALLMALAGTGVAWLQLRLAFQPREPVLVRCLWVASSASLAAGMALATLYGLRFFAQPWPWLDLPWMRALHGSINALGFAFCGVFAWWAGARGFFPATENTPPADRKSR